MGMGHLHLRKILKEETLYKDKSAARHKCDFSQHCILKAVDEEKRYRCYNVMKCSECLSFKSIPEPGNIQGCVLDGLTDEQKELPVIKGYCKHYYNVVFSKLENIAFGKENK